MIDAEGLVEDARAVQAPRLARAVRAASAVRSQGRWTDGYSVTVKPAVSSLTPSST
jgi:hypothetical protein